MLSETGKHNDGGEVLSAAVPILTNKTKYKFHYSDCPDLNMQTHHKAQFIIKYLGPKIEVFKMLYWVFFKISCQSYWKIYRMNNFNVKDM